MASVGNLPHFRSGARGGCWASKQGSKQLLSGRRTDASSAKQTATEGAGKVANQVTHRMRNRERGRAAAEVEWDLGSPPLLSSPLLFSPGRNERGKVGNGVRSSPRENKKERKKWGTLFREFLPLRFCNISLSCLRTAIRWVLGVLHCTVWGVNLLLRFCYMFSTSHSCFLGHTAAAAEELMENIWNKLPPQTVRSVDVPFVAVAFCGFPETILSPDK